MLKDNIKKHAKLFAIALSASITITQPVLASNDNNSSRNSTMNTDDSFKNGAALGGGTSIGTYNTVNKITEEEKFHSINGHGFAAEYANDLNDNMKGTKSEVVGGNNVKNGADRVVTNPDGSISWIQSKYYNTGEGCIEACFDEQGIFRYIDGEGNPMLIEVPKDKYAAAVDAMRKKIELGKIPGVTDPEEAGNLVKQGSITYKQAVNIAKAGNIDSLIYDAQKSAVTCASVFGVSAVVTYALSRWNGESREIALKKSAQNGLRVGGTAFIVSIASSQLAKAGVNSALVPASEALTRSLGSQNYALVCNAFRPAGSQIAGAAAMKSTAKILRCSMITTAVTLVVFTVPDAIDLFRGRISAKQMLKNVTSTTAGIAGGAGGWLAGAAIGSSILPGPGTILGGLIGGVAAGGALGFATDKVMDHFIEDDAEEMYKIIVDEFNILAEDYLITNEEGEQISKKLQNKLSGNEIKKMYASKDQRLYARSLMEPLFTEEIAKRDYIDVPSADEMQQSVVAVLQSTAIVQ